MKETQIVIRNRFGNTYYIFLHCNDRAFSSCEGVKFNFFFHTLCKWRFSRRRWIRVIMTMRPYQAHYISTGNISIKIIIITYWMRSHAGQKEISVWDPWRLHQKWPFLLCAPAIRLRHVSCHYQGCRCWLAFRLSIKKIFFFSLFYSIFIYFLLIALCTVLTTYVNAYM